MRKLRELNRREKQNILKLEIDEIMADSTVKVNEFITAIIKRVILSEVLNSSSPRFFSFIDLIIRERLINPFFRLLDSPDKNAKMP
jgi:hypothetical protein